MTTEDHEHLHPHTQDHAHHRTHDPMVPHTHEQWEHPGLFHKRDAPLGRDYKQRTFTIGIGGPVGSGKTALLLALCRKLRARYQLAVVTNDIFTREDAEFLVRHEALPQERIRAVETGGCPHAAVRDDISHNLVTLERLMVEFHPDLMFVESGGDNLAAQFSRELVDYTLYVIDVAGGDKIPRKGGPGITQSDLLVINKTDLAPLVGADLSIMDRDACTMRSGGPVIFAQAVHDVGVDDVVDHILRTWQKATATPRSDRGISPAMIPINIFDLTLSETECYTAPST